MNRRSISFKDLIAECFRKIIWILVIVAIVTICMFVYRGYKLNNYDSTVVEVETDIQNITLDDLTQDERYAAETYMYHYKEYLSKVEYNENSILMSLDGRSLNCTNLIYSLVSSNGDSEKCEALALSIDAYIKNGVFEDPYIQELVSSLTNGSVVSIRVLGVDEKDAEANADILNGIIGEYFESIQENDSIQLKLMEKVNHVVIDNDLSNKQYARMTEMMNCKSRADSLKETLSETSRKYVELILYGEVSSQTNVVASPDKITLVLTSKKKTIFIGIVLGTILGFIVVFCKYYLGNDIKLEEDIQQLYEVTYAGEIPIGKRTKINEIVEKAFYPNKRRKRIKQFAEAETISKLAAMCNVNNISKLSFIGVAAEYQEQLKHCVDTLQKKNIEVVVIDYQANPAEYYVKIQDSEGIVLVEQLRKTTTNQVDKQIQTCKELKAQVLAYIMLVK